MVYCSPEAITADETAYVGDRGQHGLSRTTMNGDCQTIPGLLLGGLLARKS